jgi:hypothetical protein
MRSFCVCARRFKKKQRRPGLPSGDADRTLRVNGEIFYHLRRNHAAGQATVACRMVGFGVITLGWLFAIGWTAVEFVRWLAD